jgi:hypothetical protein
VEAELGGESVGGCSSGIWRACFFKKKNVMVTASRFFIYIFYP